MVGITSNEKLFRRSCNKFSRYLEMRQFLSHVKIGSPDECWEWKNSSTGGYGSFYWKEKGVRSANQAAYDLFVGKRHGLFVCHSCDNPRCVNPNHLWLGTQQQNIADRDKKRRQSRGEGRPAAKLTLELVDKIRKLHQSGNYTYVELGKLFKVHPTTILSAVSRDTWKN